MEGLERITLPHRGCRIRKKSVDKHELEVITVPLFQLRTTDEDLIDVVDLRS